jgi:N-acyl-L-homoserine lactone synthetase
MMNISVLTSDISHVHQQFAIEIVNTPGQLREVFRLRHQVYCVERGYEPGDDGQEIDEFDDHSRHVLLRHTSDGSVVGTVRLIGADRAALGDSFPMQRLCEPGLLHHVPLMATGEVSRFAISKQRRLGSIDATLLRLSLVRGLVELSSLMGITHWLAVMERGLVRLNERNEIHFDSIGPLVSYHGIRQPMAASLVQLLSRVRREQFGTWDFLTCGGLWCSEKERVHEAV